MNGKALAPLEKMKDNETYICSTFASEKCTENKP